MAFFCCDNCGKCCTSLGIYIRIERQLTEQDYYCKNDITGELFPVHVQPEFAREIDEEYVSGIESTTKSRNGCVFHRRNPESPSFICAIYPSRPQICRDFRCYHMIIRNSGGDVAGKVVGKTDIQTSDAILARIWNAEVKLLPYNAIDGSGRTASPCSDPSWLQQVSAILASHCYRCDPVT